MKKASPNRPAPKTGAKVRILSIESSVETKKADAPVFLFALGSMPLRKPRYQKPQAVKYLEELADIDNQRRHPHTPAKYLAKSKYRDDTANGLTRCIIDFIKLNGGQAERVNTTGIPIDRRREVTDVLGHSRIIGSVEWRKSGGTVGSADISATIRGRSVKIEVKIGGDKQSPAQQQYQAAIEAAGGLYYIARNFTDFLHFYHENFRKTENLTCGKKEGK